MPEPTIITLTAYPDIFESCIFRSLQRYEPAAKKLVVTSGEASRKMTEQAWGEANDLPNWQVMHGPEPFCFSRNANLGIKACQGDVLLVNDDVEFLRSGSLSMLGVASKPACIRSPQISGVVGNKLQSYESIIRRSVESQERLCFVCVYIPRIIFDTIGFLDESFTGYGGEDSDFCIRAQQAGFYLSVTPDVVVKHGFQEHQWSSSYRRAMGYEEYLKATKESADRYLAKWT